jgi:hypothetical protein
LENIVRVYQRFPARELLTFFGISKRFGLIYEWVDDLKYVGKLRDVTVHGILLRDADLIEVAGEKKYIDFWSDPKGDAKIIDPVKNTQVLDNGKPDYTEKKTNCAERYNMAEARGSHYETAGDFSEALVWFNKALNIKRTPEILNKIGHCHVQMEKLPEAYKVYSESIILDSGQENVQALLEGIKEMCPDL